MFKIAKDYIDDGAYTEFNGYALVLTTSNGICDENTIEFDAHGIAVLERFIQRIKAGPSKAPSTPAFERSPGRTPIEQDS